MDPARTDRSPVAYREFAPPPHLAGEVECVWVADHAGTTPQPHRVVPDGCADVLYTRVGNAATTGLRFVGPMTRFQDFPQPARSRTVGVRFRPGMWAGLVAVRGAELSDRVVPLTDVWSTNPGRLHRQLDDADDLAAVVRCLVVAIPSAGPPPPLRAALDRIVRSHGQCPLDAAAAVAGVGPRQFRRQCLDATGLSPKLLARIVRFRRADTLAPTRVGRQAHLAAECGYADQSHLIADARRFAGRTPTGRTDAAAEAVWESNVSH